MKLRLKSDAVKTDASVGLKSFNEPQARLQTACSVNCIYHCHLFLLCIDTAVFIPRTWSI